MSNSSSSRNVLLSVIGIAIIIIAVVGVTFAFFNFIRIGSPNTFRVGKIYFNTNQTDTINLTNVFPIASSEATGENTNYGEVVIEIQGDTDYSEGIEYLVSAVNVNNSVGVNSIPISVDISYSNNGNGKTIGIEDANYFTNRGGNSSIYKILTEETIKENDQLLVGYIAKGATGIDGNIEIRAYLDADKIAISDTYPPTKNMIYTLNPEITSGMINDCVEYMTGRGYNMYLLEDESMNSFCSGEGTFYGYTLNDWIDSGADYDFFINNNYLLEQDVNGTTNEWVDGRAVFTTTEWNSLQENGISFKIKVEANEGIWVEEQIPTISSCLGCKFMFTTNTYRYGANNANATEVSTLVGVTNDYRTLNKKYFLGFTETQDGKIDRAFVCGIKGENPHHGTVFCIEGSADGSTYTSNSTFLNTLYGSYDPGTEIGCSNDVGNAYCHGSVGANANNSGFVNVYFGGSGCGAYSGGLYCYNS